MELNKNYEAASTEKKWYKYWNENDFFKPIEDKNKKPFTILIPPPNVTGILHMGHVLNNTLQDVAIRFHRMLQEPTLWIPGTDHAGIATQNMVEKELAKEGKTRHDIGREELVKKIWEWKEQKGSHIIEQLKQLGASCDWSKERFTMDEGLSKAVKEVFIHLYNKGLIYKGKYIINWCPRCVTALANDEVEYSEKKGKLWHIRYPFEDKSGYLVVATTRPETMLGDVAVAVNPKDERYSHLIGKNLILPVANRLIPVIADDYVDKEFGTGCVKITPAHDPNDFEVGLRHNLEQLIVMDEHGKMNETAGEKLSGVDRFKARKIIIEQLENENLLEKTDNHDNSVGHCYRCDTVIEPYLSDQWFVKMKPLAEKAIKVVETGEIKFQPERWTKVYMHWMNNIRDWCISRQIWWGHRIPAYYCNQCNELIVSADEPIQCSKCQGNSFRQDEDVLDTWFSSWIWPFSTMGWPEKTKELDYYLPTNLLITAPEIIYLWVARMIMATLEFQGKIPFDTVLLHGIVRDSQGRKMSKSLGNSPDPIDIINNVGADALRFSIVFSSPKGQDSYYSDEILETGRNFCNKIWNAFRFMMMNIETIEGLPAKDELKMDIADKWIYSRLNQVSEEVYSHYQNLRFNDAAQVLMQFIWDEFCSWYLEMAKEKFYNDKQESTLLTTKYVLLDVMQSAMRLLHPIMPFITEEVWQLIKSIFPMQEKALIIADFPKADMSLIDNDINYSMSLIQKTITAIRNLRKQVNIPLGKEVDISLKVSEESQIQLYNNYRGYVSKLAKVSDLKVSIDMKRPDSSLVAVVEDVQIFMPLGGLVDLYVEKNKLLKQKDKLEKELNMIENKLKNEKFISNAKQDVIDKEKEKQSEVSAKLNTVTEVLKSL